MLTKCKVLMNNEAVTVIDFNGLHVQVPAIGRKADTVTVIERDGIPVVVADDYVEVAAIEEEKPKKLSRKKKTPVVDEETDTEVLQFG